MSPEDGPVLPQELLDLVIDHLADDLQTLRSCALVSSSVLQYSRVHIFSRLRVGPLNKDNLRDGPLDGDHAIGTLLKLFRHSPTVAARVKSLHLWDNIMRRFSWISAEATPHPVAQFSSFLVSLTRLCITIESGFVHWANISPAMRTSIRATVALPNLTCLEIAGMYGLPYTLLAHCPALRSITLKWSTFDERDDHDFASTLAACAGSPRIELENLDLELDSSVLRRLARWILLPESPLDVTRLSTFTCVCDHPSDSAVLQQLIDAAEPALQSLRLQNVANPLDLHALAQLRTLEFAHELPLEPRVTWLRNHIIFPLPPRTLDLVLHVITPRTGAWAPMMDLIGADRALSLLPPCVAGISVVLAGSNVDRPRWGAPELELVDVSSEYSGSMPALRDRQMREGREPFHVLRHA
ncbi:hypothetical protein FB45DRAFT_479793 [Roridomyces roridus]|uniref:F-box domain-containing protein n=1 Tax=Roridomyces roridus TaxID=1738132 RepID=A0AAD7BZP4_9AGAR|nr:hypothetical protein FB45DRAFT_479793 [Roridomyces roridus]